MFNRFASHRVNSAFWNYGDAALNQHGSVIEFAANRSMRK
jgi:hypothetical protein